MTDIYVPSKQNAANIVKQFGSPAFVTDAKTLRASSKQMINAFSHLNTKIFYAIKANFNPHIVKVLKESGIHGIDAVSPFEIQLALDIGFKPDEIIYTPSNASTDEIKYAAKHGVLPNIGSKSELIRFGKLFPGSKVSVRLSPGVGEGEFDQITTGQEDSKFGVTQEELNNIKQHLDTYNLELVGIHSHIGSGFYSTKKFKQSVEAVIKAASDFDSLEFLDFGGGFGVNYKPSEPEIHLDDFAKAIEEPIKEFEKKNNKKIEIRLEPGKFLVTKSTVLLTEATTIKRKAGITFVGVNSGFNHLIRPAMYGAYHHVVNLSSSSHENQNYRVVGNLCETCDVFNESIEMPVTSEGDILAILSSGGYCASMSSHYNLRPKAAEILIDNDTFKLVRKREMYEDIMESFLSYTSK